MPKKPSYQFEGCAMPKVKRSTKLFETARKKDVEAFKSIDRARASLANCNFLLAAEELERAARLVRDIMKLKTDFINTR